MNTLRSALVSMVGLLAISVSSFAEAASLKILTDRPQDRIQKALDEFSQKTGIDVEVLVAPYAELKAKLKAGERADVLLLKDMIFITDAAREGFFTPMSSANMSLPVDPSMRDPQGQWTALAYRIRTIAFDPQTADGSHLKTYEDLAGKALAGQLCMRNSKEYMPALVAWLITRYGEAKAEAIVTGWKANLSTAFTMGDTASLQSIESGACTATITNHYYLARLKAADQRFPVSLMFADQNEGGLHTNGFGGGLVKGSTQTANGNVFLDFMLSPAGQSALVAAPSFEIPALISAKPERVVQNFGVFKSSDLNWNEVGANVAKAGAILERIEWAK